MSRRLYLGHIPGAAQRADIEDFFAPYGKINDVRLMAGFGFIEFDDARDAEDAVREANGKDFMGDRLMVEFAKSPRPYSDGPPRESRGPMRFGPRGSGWRLTVSGLPEGSSWQDLKDFARSAGTVSYADVSRNDPTEGTIEFPNQADYENALKSLDGGDINGKPVKLLDNFGPPVGGGSSSGGGGGYSRPPRDDYSRGGSSRYDRDDRYSSSRRDDRDRDYRRDDRDRDRDYGRRRDDYDRRDRDRDDDRRDSRRDRDRSRSRSRSPPRRERERSPAPRSSRDDRSKSPRSNRD